MLPDSHAGIARMGTFLRDALLGDIELLPRSHTGGADGDGMAGAADPLDQLYWRMGKGHRLRTDVPQHVRRS